jgi:hypothetical protein
MRPYSYQVNQPSGSQAILDATHSSAFDQNVGCLEIAIRQMPLMKPTNQPGDLIDSAP